MQRVKSFKLQSIQNHIGALGVNSSGKYASDVRYDGLGGEEMYTSYLGLMSDIQYGKKMVPLNDVQYGKKMFPLFEFKVANNNFFLNLNSSC